MKIDNGLAILARQNPLSEEDWFTLVEIRKGMLQESLRDMSLGALGELRMVHDYFGTHTLERDNPLVQGVTNLDVRGIFPPDDNWAVVSGNTQHHRDDSGYARATTEKLWGLTRNGVWITIEVYITRSREPYKHPGRTEEVARAKEVVIRSIASLSEVCSFSKRTPEYIWNRLGQVVKDWTEQRKRLYEDAQALREDILREEALYKVLSGK